MFVVDDVLSKLKGFSFNKGKVIEVIVRIRSSLHFYREKGINICFWATELDIDLSYSITIPAR